MHQQTAKNYDVVWANLQDTLFSICNQNADNYHAIVVANEIRTLDPSISSDKVTFLQSNEPPNPTQQPHKEVAWTTKYHAHSLDKAKKRKQALAWAEHYMQPTHYAFADADDYVSRNLIKWVNESNSQVICVNRGLIIHREEETYAEIDKFVHYCGTSIVAKAELVALALGLSEDDVKMREMLGNHQYWRKMPHHPLAQPAAGYRMHNENYARFLWWYTGWKRPHKLTNAVRREFGIR